MIIEVHALIKNKTKAVAIEMGDGLESTSVNFLKTLVAQKLGIDPKYTRKLAVNGWFIEDDSLKLSLVFSEQKDLAKKFGLGVSIVLAGMAFPNPATNAVLLGAQIISSLALAIPGQLVGQKAAVTLLKKEAPMPVMM